jgi:hypothetical protein
MADILVDFKREKINTWLSTIEYEKHHKNAREGLLKDTGRWLLQKPHFNEWKTSSASGVLWLHGIREYLFTLSSERIKADTP